MKLTATVDDEVGTVYITGTNIPQCTATVYRYNDDGTTLTLRGASNFAVTSGVLNAEDPEAPINVPLRYVVLFNIGDRVVQRNLFTNPSFETNSASVTAGPFRTVTSSTPDYPAFVGNRVLRVTPRTPQSGDAVDPPPLAPLCDVAAAFTVPAATPRDYELSVRARLTDVDGNYYSSATIQPGNTPVSWDQAYSMYRSWNQVYYGGLTWADLETSYLNTYTPWSVALVDMTSPEWTVQRGALNGGTVTLNSDTSAAHGFNYVLNPALRVSAAGYTSSTASGAPPTLARTALVDGGYGLAVGLTGGATSSRVAYTVPGLVAGTQYYAAVRALLPVGQTIQLALPGTPYSSLTVSGTGTTQWVSAGVYFTAAASSAQVNVLLSSNSSYTATLAQFQVSDPGIDYFDGGLPDDADYFYRWTGTDNASASERLPFATVLAPAQPQYDDYEFTWTVTTPRTVTCEITYGAVDAAGNELMTPVHAIVSAEVEGPAPAGALGSGAFGDGTFPGGGSSSAYGDGVYGNDLYDSGETGSSSSAYGAGGYGDGGYATNGSNTVHSGTYTALVHPLNWPVTWRPYLRVSYPGASVTYAARYRTIAPATYYPYTVPLRAQVVTGSGTGTVVVDSGDVSAFVTVGAFSTLRWRFTLPPTTTGTTYRVRLVPDQSLAGAATDWELDGLLLESAPFQEGRLDYLDGSVAVPTVSIPGWFDPADLTDYDSASADALIRWTGTAHASTSEFLGPAQVTATLTAQLGVPVGASVPNCEPVNLTDPTVPALAGWFTLQSISGLHLAARTSVTDVLSRRAPVVISQVRRTPSGTLTLLTQSLAERDTLLDLVASGRVLLLRNPDSSYPESSWYISINDVNEERVAADHRLAYRRFTFEFDVVDRPGGLIYRPAPPTWSAVDTTYDAWGPVNVQTSVAANVSSWAELTSETPSVTTPFSLRAGAEATVLGPESGAYGAALEVA